jgi:CRISPR/Cas system-associated exonuclease Cas4 (RecB family)
MDKDKLTKLIEKSQEQVTDEPRDYIGASIIGSDCLRQIWYEFKGEEAQGVPAKFRRTWAIGKRLEGLIIEWLINAGIKVLTFDVTYKSGTVSEFRGHIDALVEINKKNYILEIKTAKNASFNIFVKKGVKIWNLQYYAQVQSYMGMSGIHSTYILVLNKDNSDLSDELVTFDPDYYERLETKAAMIESATIEPPRINGSPLFFKCKMCKFNKVCHQ